MCAASIFDELAAINKPALVIAGEHDQTAPRENCQSIAAAIPGSRFHLIEGTGHVIYLEAPNSMNSCLGQFLAQLGRGFESGVRFNCPHPWCGPGGYGLLSKLC